ncbi:hypothetical protein [Deinococcus ruber]|nr:hypothetical protein [Deinococcus ruber]
MKLLLCFEDLCLELPVDTHRHACPEHFHCRARGRFLLAVRLDGL